jgi:hypothetical protein
MNRKVVFAEHRKEQDRTKGRRGVARVAGTRDWKI